MISKAMKSTKTVKKKGKNPFEISQSQSKLLKASKVKRNVTGVSVYIHKVCIAFERSDILCNLKEEAYTDLGKMKNARKEAQDKLKVCVCAK